MKKLQVLISHNSKQFVAVSEVIGELRGAGKTVEDAKFSLMKSIGKLQRSGRKRIPEILKGDFSVEYRLDVKSLLNLYKGIITNAALERITGINQRLIQHYASGLKKPRQPQARKIEKALHKLGAELLEIRL